MKTQKLIEFEGHLIDPSKIEFISKVCFDSYYANPSAYYTFIIGGVSFKIDKDKLYYKPTEEDKEQPDDGMGKIRVYANLSRNKLIDLVKEAGGLIIR